MFGLFLIVTAASEGGKGGTVWLIFSGFPFQKNAAVQRPLKRYSSAGTFQVLPSVLFRFLRWRGTIPWSSWLLFESDLALQEKVCLSSWSFKKRRAIKVSLGRRRKWWNRFPWKNSRILYLWTPGNCRAPCTCLKDKLHSTWDLIKTWNAIFSRFSSTISTNIGNTDHSSANYFFPVTLLRNCHFPEAIKKNEFYAFEELVWSTSPLSGLFKLLWRKEAIR